MSNVVRLSAMARMVCRVCAAPVDAPGAVFALVGPEVRPYCCGGHAAREKVWPWHPLPKSNRLSPQRRKSP
jgi:hypothetical protein